MKTTISDIRSQLNTLERNYSRISQKAQRAMVITKIRELNGSETVIDEVENFDDLMKDMREHASEIARLKGIVARLNSETRLSDGRSISETVAHLAGLRSERALLVRAQDMRPSIRRRDGSGLNATAYYDVTELNFDKTTVEARVKELTEMINTLESELNRLNSTEIDVPDYNV